MQKNLAMMSFSSVSHGHSSSTQIHHQPPLPLITIGTTSTTLLVQEPLSQMAPPSHRRS
ncbi:hypothetical protein TorRG33x02_285050 [Trema orientale]|uniref:Uncharacterized protein n=1 Tax=Trema orientale TaxID=63057 RepID=A0A2P5CGW0_TREOI|nr:hypothetical protein TorRG33x02_285050 [Trema orientale]